MRSIWLASSMVEVKYQVKPCVIYTSTKCEESFLAALQSSDGKTEAPTVKFVKSSLFSYGQAWHRCNSDKRAKTKFEGVLEAPNVLTVALKDFSASCTLWMVFSQRAMHVMDR